MWFMPQINRGSEQLPYQAAKLNCDSVQIINHRPVKRSERPQEPFILRHIATYCDALRHVTDPTELCHGVICTMLWSCCMLCLFFGEVQEPIIYMLCSCFLTQLGCSDLAWHLSAEWDDPYDVQRLCHTVVRSKYPGQRLSVHDGLAKDKSLPELHGIDKERSFVVAFCADGEELR